MGSEPLLFGFGLPAVLLATIVAQHSGVGGVELGASALGAPHMSLQIDSTSLSFFLLLTLIASTCAGLSMSYVYQGGTPRKLYFLFYWSFYLSMVGLIFSGDLVSMFLFWDGLGITSFFLVGLFNSSGPRSGALLTLLSNRLGDVSLILGTVGIWGSGGLVFGTWSNGVGWGGAFMLFGLLCKSAQWPVSGWLPAAMSAPTPVSALVHSSTLVTAGLYICIRLGPSLGEWGWIWFGVGVFTFLLGGASAVLSYDLKRVVAMSTLSHLGLMSATLATGYSSIVFFHLLAHALFKSNAFLAAGNLITASKHTQDLRLMGTPTRTAPISSISLLLSVWSWGGLPSALSYFSKGAGVMGGCSWGTTALLGGGVVMGLCYTSRLAWSLLGSGNAPAHPVSGLVCWGAEYPVFLSTCLGIIGCFVWGGNGMSPMSNFGWEACIISLVLGVWCWGGAGIVGAAGGTAIYHIGSVLSSHSVLSLQTLQTRKWEQQAGFESIGRGGWGTVKFLGQRLSGMSW